MRNIRGITVVNIYSTHYSNESQIGRYEKIEPPNFAPKQIQLEECLSPTRAIKLGKYFKTFSSKFYENSRKNSNHIQRQKEM